MGWVLSWNIQPRGGMQTEEPKRKPYDVLEKGEAFAYVHLTRFQKRPSRIELSRPRARVHMYRGCRKNSLNIKSAPRLTSSSGHLRSILWQITSFPSLATLNKYIIVYCYVEIFTILVSYAR